MPDAPGCDKPVFVSGGEGIDDPEDRAASQYLNIKPLLPKEVTDLFPSTGPGSLPAMYISPQYRARNGSTCKRIRFTTTSSCFSASPRARGLPGRLQPGIRCQGVERGGRGTRLCCLAVAADDDR